MEELDEAALKAGEANPALIDPRFVVTEATHIQLRGRNWGINRERLTKQRRMACLRLIPRRCNPVAFDLFHHTHQSKRLPRHFSGGKPSIGFVFAGSYFSFFNGITAFVRLR